MPFLTDCTGDLLGQEIGVGAGRAPIRDTLANVVEDNSHQVSSLMVTPWAARIARFI